MENNDKNILVGKIVAPQGIRGDVRVQTYTEHPGDFRKLEIISNRFASSDFKFVRLLNPTSNVVIAHINGINSRNDAELLRNTDLFISRNALPDTAQNEYYQADLIGFDVIRDGVKIGRVDGFQNFGAGDIIELDNGDMISFIGASVDMSTRTIMVK